MLTAALVVSDGLGRGFDRAAGAADLPDAIVRFDPEPAGQVAARIAALPDLAAFSLRREFTGVELDAPGHTSENAAVEIIGPGRRGYAIVAGRDLSGRPGEVLVERGLAAAWGMPLGGRIELDGSSPQRVVGFTESPDNVSYPLAGPRVYVAQVGVSVPPGVNLAEIWLRDPHRLDEVLVQARATSYGVHGLRFVTRAGVRVLLDQAAGIVIDLLVALSLIALLTAAVMLAASARAEVQRRLQAIGLRRAVGASRSYLTATQGLEALIVAAPAATIGLIAGTLATYGPTSRLLMMLNEPAPGAALALPLAAAWMAAVAIPVTSAAWPAWRAAGRAPVALLRGAELAAARSRRRASPIRAGLTVLGARLAGARRARLVATATALGSSTGFVLLMLALASALVSLETDPGALGKRYQLTAQLPPAAVGQVRAIPGVQAAAPRYADEAVDSFSLQETIDVIAYPGDHTEFEAPPLLGGSRIARPDEAEVGAGLADALGLVPGSTLAIQLASGGELRLRVAGVVGSLDHDGRVAYVPARALLARDPSASEQLVVRVRPGADLTRVTAALGATAAPAAGATARGVPLVDTLRAILRAVAIVDGLVCLYALIQTCALTVQERRRTLSVIRAVGAGTPAITRLLAGAALALVAPAAAIGIALERWLLGPALARLAAGYATLSLGAGAGAIAAVLAGLVVAATVAVLWVARRAGRESVVSGLAAP
ncbi:MAG: ABC transporter permease [Solirubrobacterales bacterium]|nr:ABC transporter permease [Solirubrobacterales bacterium]